MLISKHHDKLEACRQVYWEEMGKYSLYIKDYKCALFTSLAKIVWLLNKMEWGWKLLTGLRHTMVLVRRPFFRYDPVRCDRPMLYGTVSERAAKTIRFNTLWQWKGYSSCRSVYWNRNNTHSSNPIPYLKLRYRVCIPIFSMLTFDFVFSISRGSKKVYFCCGGGGAW